MLHASGVRKDNEGGLLPATLHSQLQLQLQLQSQSQSQSQSQRQFFHRHHEEQRDVVIQKRTVTAAKALGLLHASGVRKDNEGGLLPATLHPQSQSQSQSQRQFFHRHHEEQRDVVIQYAGSYRIAVNGDDGCWIASRLRRSQRQ